MFLDIIKDYIDKFEIEKQTIFEKKLFEKRYFKQYLFMTPIWVPVIVKIEVRAGLDLEIDFGINQREIELEPKLIAEVTSDMSASLFLAVVEIGGYAEATIFKGVLSVALVLAINSDSFKGSFKISVHMQALVLDIGFFYKHITLRIIKKCVKVWGVRICVPIPIP